jgi:SAM-dependent methyltransferase
MNTDQETAAATDGAGVFEGRLNRPAIPARPVWFRNISLASLTSEMLGRIQEGEFSNSEHSILLGSELEEALRPAIDVHINRMSRQRCFDLFSNLCEWEESVRGLLRGATVVELGCGSLNPFGLLFVILMAGAQRAIAIDLDGVQDMKRAVKVLADLAGIMLVNPASLVGEYPISRYEILQNIGSFDLTRLQNGDVTGIDASRLVYKQDSVHAMTLKDGEADIIVSTAFLEHITSVDAALSEMARVTRPGGIGVHIIDGSDHRRYGASKFRPLDFLTEDVSDELVYGSNRIRPLLFGQLFERHGFEVLSMVPFEEVDISPQLRSRLVEPFSSMPEEVLSVIGAKIVTRRLES